MAEAIEIELKVSGDDAVAALRKLRDALGGVGDRADKTGGSVKNLGANLGGWATTAREALGYLDKLISGVRAFGEELDRRSAVLDAFSGGLEEAQRRTSGLVSQLDLMIASNTAAQAGFRLTERQLANVAVAATQYAEATGDASITTESLARAIAAGEEGPLKKLGISLEGVTGQARKQEEALRQLEEVYGDTSVEADNLGDMFQQAEVFADDLTTSFFEGFAATEELNRAFSDLGDAIRPLATVLGIDLKDGMDIAIRAGAALAAQLAHLVDGISAMVRAIDELSSGRFEGALNEAAASAAAFGRVGLGGALGDAFATGGAGDRAVAARDARLAEGGNPGRTRPPPRGRGRGQREDLSPQGGTFGDFFLGLDTARDAGRDSATVKEQEEAARQIAESIRQQEEAVTLLNEARQRGIELENESAEAQARSAQEAIALTQERIQLQQQLFALAEQGAEAAFEIFRIAEGPQEAIRAAIEAAKAFASYPDPIGIASHTIAAVAHAANAARLGFGSSVQTPGAGAARPVAPSNSTAHGGGGTSLVVNYNAPQSSAEVGEMQRRNARALHARFDA